MSTACPNNSTECLLRAILDANSGYNWDPVNFGFTASFTIIAFLVSVTAMFQSFVAAGPGRLKASERAIGPKQHKRRADVHFSWKEFRFRTIVNVPVIDLGKILEHSHDVIPIDHKHKDVTPLPLSSTRTPRVVAGWSQLLNDLSLTDIDFDTIECLTDYVPDDIPAAPAWGRVESIIMLCIMKGCTRLREDEDNGFISAIGASIQLSWNMHPTLGPMAVYRTWDTKDISVHNLYDVQKMVPIFQGELYLDGKSIYKPMTPRAQDIPVHFDFMQLRAFSAHSWSVCQHQHDHCINRKHEMWSIYQANKTREGGADKETAALASALFADRPAKAMAFPLNVTRMHSALLKMYEEYFPWLVIADDLDDRVLRTLCDTSFVEFDERHGKPNASVLFQTHLSSWLPTASRLQASQPGEKQSLDRPKLDTSRSTGRHNHGKASDRPSLDEKLLSSDLRIARPAVQYLSRWFSDESYFHNIGKSELIEVRKWLAYQLSELDWFLSLQGDDAICAASNLVAIGSVKYGVVYFTRLSRRFVMPETLEAFNLSWTPDPDDVGRLIVKGSLDKETVQRLYAYTRSYIDQNRKNLHTVKCPQVANGYYFAKNKPHLKQSASEPTERPPTSNFDELMYPVIDPNGNVAFARSPGAVVKDASVVHTEPIGQELSATSTESTTAAEYKSSLGSPDTGTNVKLHDWLAQSREKSSEEDEIAVRVDPRISALEALAFFRAGIFGALLATGTDTSLVLLSDKRYQLVQLQ